METIKFILAFVAAVYAWRTLFGGEKHRILINIEKIDYVQEQEGGVTSIHLSDVPLDYFGEKDLFPKSMHVATPYEIVWDDIMKGAIKNEQT